MKETKDEIDSKPTIKLSDIASNIVTHQSVGGVHTKS